MPGHQSPEQVVRAFVAAISKKDFEAARPYLAEACEYTNMPTGTVTGAAATIEFLSAFFAPTRENEFVFKHVVSDGAVVVIERLDRHHIDRGWVELPVTGVWEVHGGLITAWREYWDLATLTREWPELLPSA